METVGQPSLTWSLGDRPIESQGALTGAEPCLHGGVLSGQGGTG